MKMMSYIPAKTLAAVGAFALSLTGLTGFAGVSDGSSAFVPAAYAQVGNAQVVPVITQPVRGADFDARLQTILAEYAHIDPAICDTAGSRAPLTVADIGAGERAYYGVTNEHGQLVEVFAKKIVVQDDASEQVTDAGRYCERMADVPGVGKEAGYDRGHVIADSLGGESNAYNITPQQAELNRHGDQAFLEDQIRKAGGADDFHTIIEYPDEATQIPSRYTIGYAVMGNYAVKQFDNVDPRSVPVVASPVQSDAVELGTAASSVAMPAPSQGKVAPSQVTAETSVPVEASTFMSPATTTQPDAGDNQEDLAVTGSNTMAVLVTLAFGMVAAGALWLSTMRRSN